jgi:hypothetical protein
MNSPERLMLLLTETEGAAKTLLSEADSPENLKAALVSFATDQGLTVTPDEVEAVAANLLARKEGALSDQQLDQVAGGGTVVNGAVVDAVAWANTKHNW